MNDLSGDFLKSITKASEKVPFESQASSFRVLMVLFLAPTYNLMLKPTGPAQDGHRNM